MIDAGLVRRTDVSPDAALHLTDGTFASNALADLAAFLIRGGKPRNVSSWIIGTITHSRRRARGSAALLPFPLDDEDPLHPPEAFFASLFPDPIAGTLIQIAEAHPAGIMRVELVQISRSGASDDALADIARAVLLEVRANGSGIKNAGGLLLAKAKTAARESAPSPASNGSSSSDELAFRPHKKFLASGFPTMTFAWGAPHVGFLLRLENLVREADTGLETAAVLSRMREIVTEWREAVAPPSSPAASFFDDDPEASFHIKRIEQLIV